MISWSVYLKYFAYHEYMKAFLLGYISITVHITEAQFSDSTKWPYLLRSFKVNNFLIIFPDEQERVQKKTFTNWINSYLKQVGINII